jgi:hypothetical protein
VVDKLPLRSSLNSATPVHTASAIVAMVEPGEEAAAPSVVGVRHGLRERTRMGTLGKTRIAVVRLVVINARAPGFWR